MSGMFCIKFVHFATEWVCLKLTKCAMRSDQFKYVYKITKMWNNETTPV